MFRVFEGLDEEKRKRIINAALEEFAKNRFSKASTNAIVEKAGISKGILFHYFKTKKQLYSYLKEFAFSTIITRINEEVDWHQPDLFIRIKEVGLIKSRVMAEYPYMASFSKVMYDEMGLDEMKALALKYNPNIYQEVYTKNIDLSKFKDTVDMERVINMTQWTFEKIGEAWFSKHVAAETFDFDALSQEVDVYLKLLKETFYKA